MYMSSCGPPTESHNLSIEYLTRVALNEAVPITRFGRHPSILYCIEYRQRIAIYLFSVGRVGTAGETEGLIDSVVRLAKLVGYVERARAVFPPSCG